MNFIIKNRIIILILSVLLMIGMGFLMTKMKKDTAVTTLLPKDDDNFKYYDDVQKTFGGIEEYIIAVRDYEGIYKVENIKLIDEISRMLKNIPDIDEDDVLSITTINNITGVDGELIIEELIPEDMIDSITIEDIENVRRAINQNKIFKDKIVSSDEKTTIIMASSTHDDKIMARIVDEIESHLNKIKIKYPNLEFYLSGDPVNEVYTSRIMDKELSYLMPLALIIVLILLFVFLRSFFGMIIPIIVVIMSIIFTFGIKVLFNSPMTITESAIPVMLIAIGCADGIHIISEFFKLLKTSLPVKEAVIETMKIMRVPVIMTSITTSLGVFSLVTSPGDSLKNMGIFLAVGVISAMIFSLIVIPVILSLYRGRKRFIIKKDINNNSNWSSLLIKKIGNIIIKYKIVIFIILIPILVISIVGVINVKVDSDQFKYLKKTNKIRIATDKIQEYLGGVSSLDIIIEGKEDDVIKRPDVLKYIEKIQEFCEKQDEVSYTLSFADYIKRMNFALNNEELEFDRIPKEIEILPDGDEISGENQVAQMLMLYEMGGGDALSEVVDFNYKRARIVVRLKDTGHLKLKKLINKIESVVTKNKPESIDVKYSNQYIVLRISSLIVNSQIQSLIITVLIIFILLSIQFKSPLLGGLTTIPVFLAIMFNFGVMWIFGITLNIGTAIIASVGMGIGIDYAIHFFTRFKAVYSVINRYDDALKETITETLPAIFTNAFAVGMGFLVLIFSNYTPISNMGWIIALTMLTTSTSSLIGLPAILSIFKPNPNGIVFNKRKNKVVVENEA